MRVRVLHHDHCFDGAASAAFFSRFYRDTQDAQAEFAYTGLAHKATQLFDDEMFDGDVNAIVDFKYATHPKLTWWFDHHQSAFLSDEDMEHWRQQGDVHKQFDPTFKSCTKFIADFAQRRYGYEPADLANLVKWADIVDGAQYESPEAAVMLREAAMQITLVIESSKGHDTVERIIRAMQEMPLEAIMQLPDIQALYRPLYERHVASIDTIRQAARCEGGVVFFDLVGTGLDGYNKFIPYYLFPQSIYTVSVSEAPFRTKVSVGSNPWVPEIDHNLASICERYGGGGHARVGAISFAVGAIEAARNAAAEITAELQRPVATAA